MAELQKLAFGGDEIQYDKLPGLGSRFALGSRDIQESAPINKDVVALDTRPALEGAAAASVQGSDPIETEVCISSCIRAQCPSHASTLTHRPLQVKAKAKPKRTATEPVLLNVSTNPTSGTAEEQFISLPDSPKASASAESAEQASKALAEQTTAVSPAGRELPWNQASAHIRSPLLRLHTGE